MVSAFCLAGLEGGVLCQFRIHGCDSNGARRDLEQFGGFGLGDLRRIGLQICRPILSAAKRHVRQAGRNHRPLAFAQVPAATPDACSIASLISAADLPADSIADYSTKILANWIWQR